MCATISGTCSVALGSTSPASTPIASMSARYSAMYRSETSRGGAPSSAARRMILSSTSVKFLTNVTRKPRASSQRRTTSKAMALRAWPTCERS